ncbi:hypothetical protein B0T11DRAFT_336075 [Plectosphaerella cucumerina]|uniref:Uncharacterized protein n=1 Tax=Plectosphaerella cucumerina TaxID=40658 RepID=A0A8K0TUH3_9PEZI|nr:hypothetical protein B0T11DRAFT_336075 [Plectosphaerella cucumerina]
MQIRQILLLQGLALFGNAQPTDDAAAGPHNDRVNALRARGPDPNNMDPALKLILGKDWREIEKKYAYDNQNKQTSKKSQEPDFAARFDFAARAAADAAFRKHRDAGTKIVLGEDWKEILLAPKLVESKTTDVKDAKDVGCNRKDKSRPLSANRQCGGDLDKRDIGEEDEEEDPAEEEESTDEDGPVDKEEPTDKPLDGSLIDLDFLKPENLLREVYEGFPTQDGRKPKTFFTSFSTQLSYDDGDGWQHHHQSVYHEQHVTWVPEEAEATPTDTVAGKYNVEDDIQTDYEHEEEATPILTRTRTKWRPRPGRKTAAPSEATTKSVNGKEEKEAAPTTTEVVVKPTRRVFGAKKSSTTEATPTSTAEADDEIEELQAETSEEITSTTVVSTSTTESSPEPTAEATEGADAPVEEATSTTVAPESTVESTSSSVEETSTAEASTESDKPVSTSATEVVDEVEAVTEQAVTTTDAPGPTTEVVDSEEEKETTAESTTAETTTVVVPSTTAEPTTTSAELSSASSTASPTAPKGAVIKDKVAVIAGAVAAAINGAEPSRPTHLGERFTTEDAELTKILAHIPKDRPWDRNIGYPKLVRAWRKKIQAEKERHGKHWKDMTQREKELWITGETIE